MHGMESPRSDTPVSSASSRLDDHRHQEMSLPRSDTMSRSRAPTFEEAPHPQLGNVQQDIERVNSYDNENAIEDGDAEDIVHTHHYGVDGIVEPTPRRPTVDTQNITPILGHASAGEHSAKPSTVEYPGRARAMSRKNPLYNVRANSRSPSPPNSVEAFASPIQRRHERSNTINSQAPPDLALNHRLTMSSANDEDDSNESTDNEKVEEDVCFPMPEEQERKDGFTGHFDLEEVDDFICNQLDGSNYRPRRRKLSTTEFSPFHRSNGARRKSTKVALAQAADDCGKTNEISLATTKVGSTEPGSDVNTNEKAGQSEEASIAESGPPDRFTFFGTDLEATIRAPEIGDLLAEGQTFRQLLSPYGEDESQLWWLDCLNPTDAEMKVLTKAFGIHPLTSEDIRMQEMREKVELFKHYYFVSFRSFVQNKKSDEYMEPINVYVVVFREGVISFQHAEKGDETHHAANVRRRIRQLRDYVKVSPDWIAYALIDDIVDAFGPTIEECEAEAEAIEDSIFTVRPEDFQLTLEKLSNCRRSVMILTRLLGGKADVIKGFAKRCNEQYAIAPRGDIGLYLGDIQDHIVTMVTNLNHFEKILARSHGNYLASLSVDSIMSNSRAADSLNKITVVATIIVPLNLICGLFGMNVNVPGKEAGGLTWFFGIIGVIVAIVAICLVAARRWKLI